MPEKRTRANHKYIAKIGNRYIYDAKELAAAKANQFRSNQAARKAQKEKEKRHKDFVKIKSKQDKETDKLRKEYQKQKDYEENYNRVPLSTFITGGEEKKQYKKTKNDYKKASRRAERQGRKVSRAERTAAAIPNRSSKSAMSAKTDAKNNREEYVRLSKIAGDKKMRMDAAEKAFEETSLSGVIHRNVKKNRKRANNIVKKVANTPVYIAKNQKKSR
jgi:hypothetical protein